MSGTVLLQGKVLGFHTLQASLYLHQLAELVEEEVAQEIVFILALSLPFTHLQLVICGGTQIAVA